MSQMPPGQPTSYSRPPQQRTNGLAIASLVLGILSIALCCFSIARIVLGILAIVFGVMGRGKATRGEAGGGGMAIAGLICGIVGVLIGLTLYVLFHFGGPAIQQRLQQWKIQTEQKIQEEQRKQQERQGTTQESLLLQELTARNLRIAVD